MLSEQLECHAEASLFDQANNSLEEENTRLDSFEISPRHLKDSLVAVHDDDSRASLDGSHVEIARFFELGQLGRLVIPGDRGSRQLLVQIIDKELVHQPRCRIDKH